MSGIPVVDLAAFTKAQGTVSAKEQQQVVETWNDAMVKAGFAVVVNHGVPEDVIRNMFAASRKFFLENNKEDKMKFNYGPYGNTKGGYTPMGDEGVGRSLDNPDAPSDLVESYVLKRDIDASSHPQSLVGIGQEYTNQMLKLMHLLHLISSKAFNGFDFDSFYDDRDAGSLRLAHYPPTRSPLPGQVRYAAHHDYTGFTILAVETYDQPTGLEVFLDGKWERVSCPKGGLIVNVGELITYWTDGAWRSTLHRVSNPPDLENASRFSIPFFTGPTDEALIVPVGTNKAPIRSIDHLMQKLKKSQL